MEQQHKEVRLHTSISLSRSFSLSPALSFPPLVVYELMLNINAGKHSVSHTYRK